MELGILQLKLNTVSDTSHAPDVLTATGCPQDKKTDLEMSCNDTPTVSQAIEANLRAQYPAIFDGIGQLKDHEQKLHIDPTVPPVSQTCRRIPFHLHKQLDVWLDDYVTKDIIEPVQDESTDWVSGLVVAPKHNNPSEVHVMGVMGAKGTVPKRLPQYLRMTRVGTLGKMIQKTALLGSART